MVFFFLKVLSSVHEVFDSFKRNINVSLAIQFLSMFFIEVVHFEYEFADCQLELLLDCLWQVEAHIILEIADAFIRLSYSCIVVVVFEEEDFPELLRLHAYVLKKGVFVDCLDNKVDVGHGLFKVMLIRLN